MRWGKMGMWIVVFALVWRAGGKPVEDDLLVDTKTGVLRGYRKDVLGRTVHVFTGIPFAKPPVGDLRFRKPVPVDPWHGVLDATSLPDSCVQEPYEYFPGFIGEEIWNPNTPLNEDCLYLNVWVTEKVQNSGTKDAPVMVWIYGGGYMSGTSTLEIYDGAILAASRDVIVASMNYRVGAFGFLCFGVPEAPCNQGLWDQAMALRWIQDNIEHFGGDSRKVTGFGESAGGGSVSTLLLSPATRHLLRRGILQSGTINAPWSYKTFDEERHASADLVKLTECGDVSETRNAGLSRALGCLRETPAANISVLQWYLYKVMDFPFAPTVDGDLLPKHPVVMLQEGDFSNVELIVGSNRDEGTYFVLYDFINAFNKDDPSLLTRDQYLAIMSEIFKQMSPIQKEAIIFQYTDWDYMDNGLKNQKMIASAVGDYFFVCPSNFFAQQFALGGATVYYYYFTWRTSSNPWGRWMGVMHGDEIDYVFGVPFNRSRNHLPIERALSERIMTHFARFAETGSPAKDEPEWPPYTRSEPKYYVFDAEKRGLGSGPRAFDCAFWNEFMPHLGRQEHALPAVSCSGESVGSGGSSGIVPPRLLLSFLSFFVFARTGRASSSLVLLFVLVDPFSASAFLRQ